MKFRRALLVGVVLAQLIVICSLYRCSAEVTDDYDELAAVSQRHYSNLVDAYTDLESRYISVVEENARLTTEVKELQSSLECFVNPIKHERAAAPMYDIPLSEELQQYTYDMCNYYGIEGQYELVLALMWQESDFDCLAVSATNDYGIMQINEVNHEYLQETLGIVDIMDPEQNIEAGVYILSDLFRKYDDVNQVLMSYNMGIRGAREQWRRGNYTSYYSAEILNKLELIKEDKYGSV